MSEEGRKKISFELIDLGSFTDALNKSKPRRKPTVRKLVLPPGYGFARAASVLLTRKAYERCVQPLIADMQYEYIDAIGRHAGIHAKWIVVRGYGLLIWSLVRELLKRISWLVMSFKDGK